MASKGAFLGATPEYHDGRFLAIYGVMPSIAPKASPLQKITRTLAALVFICINAATFAQHTSTPTLPYLNNLSQTLAQVKQSKKPLLILFSQDNCPFCHNVRQDFLRHIANDPKAQIIVREVQHDSGAVMQVQAGKTETAAAFTRRMGIKFYPTVMLYDSELKPLADPLLGSDRSGFYGAYLERAMDEAVGQLK